MPAQVATEPAQRWDINRIVACMSRPLHDLLHEAQSIHRRYFDANQVQLSTLVNIKSGGCPEDCSYCPQSARYQTGVRSEPLMEPEQVRERAHQAREAGATRLCLGAAWRSPRGQAFERVLEMVKVVVDEGLESCATLGMLTQEQAHRLKRAGLDYYNHNIDSSPEFYGEIISTRIFEDRLETLDHVRSAGIAVCCGGIVGMGESRWDRARMLEVLASLPQPPESVPINMLVRIPGTPLEHAGPVDAFELVRTLAAARILMPQTWLRLSAGREQMSDELQALCFHAGANSIFYGEQLLTAPNPQIARDQELLRRLGMEPQH